jgi:hypothetical protein
VQQISEAVSSGIKKRWDATSVRLILPRTAIRNYRRDRTIGRRLLFPTTPAAQHDGRPHMMGRSSRFDCILNVEDANIPLPHVQRVATVHELFLPVQFEFVQSFDRVDVERLAGSGAWRKRE